METFKFELRKISTLRAVLENSDNEDPDPMNQTKNFEMQ